MVTTHANPYHYNHRFSDREHYRISVISIGFHGTFHYRVSQAKNAATRHCWLQMAIRNEPLYKRVFIHLLRIFYSIVLIIAVKLKTMFNI